MTNYKKDLQKEQMAHAETKKKLEALKASRSEQKASEKVVEKIRYVRTPDLTQVSVEELQRALDDYKGK